MNTLGILAGSYVTGFVGYTMHHNKKNKQENENYNYIRILPHIECEMNADKIIRFIESYAAYINQKKARPWFRFVVHMDEQEKIAFYLGFNRDYGNGIKRSIETVYPQAELHPVPFHKMPFPNKRGGHGGVFHLSGQHKGLPLKPFEAKKDELADVLTFLEPKTWIILDFSPTDMQHLKHMIKKAQTAYLPKGGGQGGTLKQQFISGMAQFGQDVFADLSGKKNGSRGPARREPQRKISDLDFDDQNRYKALRERFTGREKVFDLMLTVWSENEFAENACASVATRIEYMMERDNHIRFKAEKRCPVTREMPVPFPKDCMLWTSQEMANLIHFPDSEDRIMERIPHLANGQRSLKDGELSEGISIGVLNHPTQQGRSVAVPWEQFTKHVVLTGITGSGKSSTALQMVQSVLDQWCDKVEQGKTPVGFTYIDPARETVATILSRLLKMEMEGRKVDWSKVHYVYLGKTDYPIGLNLLHKNEGEDTEGIATDAFNLLKFAFNTGPTPQLDRILKNSLETLVQDDVQQHTLLGVQPLLTNDGFRNRILPQITELTTKQFWQTDIPENALIPVLNRLDALVGNKTMRRMFGQKKWSPQIRKYMDEGHIFLIDLLNVDAANVRLTAGHLINQYHITAKTRSSGSNFHLLMVDESHLVQIPIMEKIIAEDRKFGLSLTLITQFVDQYQQWLIKAVKNNVGTILSCTQGTDSAPAVSEMTAGRFTKTYLQELPERVVAVFTKDKVDNRSVITTFTVSSDPPYIYRPSNEEDRVKMRAEGKPETSFVIANHKVEAEMIEALQWGLRRGIELQREIGTPAAEVDQEIENYVLGRAGYRRYTEDDEQELEGRRSAFEGIQGNAVTNSEYQDPQYAYDDVL